MGHSLSESVSNKVTYWAVRWQLNRVRVYCCIREEGGGPQHERQLSWRLTFLWRNFCFFWSYDGFSTFLVTPLLVWSIVQHPLEVEMSLCCCLLQICLLRLQRERLRVLQISLVHNFQSDYEICVTIQIREVFCCSRTFGGVIFPSACFSQLLRCWKVRGMNWEYLYWRSDLCVIWLNLTKIHTI